MGSRPRDLHLFSTGTLFTAIVLDLLIKLFYVLVDGIRYGVRVLRL